MKKILNLLLLVTAFVGSSAFAAEIQDANGNTVTYCSGTLTIPLGSNTGTFVCSNGDTYTNCSLTTTSGVYSCTSNSRPYDCRMTSNNTIECKLAGAANSALPDLTVGGSGMTVGG